MFLTYGANCTQNYIKLLLPGEDQRLPVFGFSSIGYCFTLLCSIQGLANDA